MRERDFPKGFVWGAASCPARSEGETVSDWGRLSAPDGTVPDDGPRHWRRYRYDYRAMAGLGIRAYRFGCDWGRLQRAPYEPFVRDDLFRYLEMLAELRSLGIEPWLVLFQDALPRWATAAGGWLNRETPHWFADYARRLADATDGEVMRWVTVHEPQMYAFSCHGWDRLPGGSWGRLDRVRRVVGNLRLGHQLAARELRRRLPGCSIGVTVPGGLFFPRRGWHPGDRLAARLSEWLLNRYRMGGFFRSGGGCDFVMLGTGNEVALDAAAGLSLSSLVSSKVAERMDENGGFAASGDARRRRLGKRIRELGMDVYVTGRADGDGKSLTELLSACAGSDAGAAGFFYEPLLDEFDPRRGLTSHHGLLRVDFHGADRRREIAAVARRLSSIIKKGKLGTC